MQGTGSTGPNLLYISFAQDLKGFGIKHSLFQMSHYVSFVSVLFHLTSTNPLVGEAAEVFNYKCHVCPQNKMISRILMCCQEPVLLFPSTTLESISRSHIMVLAW